MVELKRRSKNFFTVNLAERRDYNILPVMYDLLTSGQEVALFDNPRTDRMMQEIMNTGSGIFAICTHTLRPPLEISLNCHYVSV